MAVERIVIGIEKRNRLLGPREREICAAIYWLIETCKLNGIDRKTISASSWTLLHNNPINGRTPAVELGSTSSELSSRVDHRTLTIYRRGYRLLIRDTAHLPDVDLSMRNGA